MNLNSLLTDPTLDQGAWVDLGDARVKLARLGSPKYQSAVARRLKPHAQTLELNLMKDEDALKIQIELLADFIVLDWTNLELNGQPFPYSRENAITALGIEFFRNWVREQATSLENFRVRETKENVEAVTKN